MPQLPYNFTGSVDVNVGDKEPEDLNFLQRFSRGYVQSRQRVAQMNARERDPMYELKQMMFQQRINQNALDLSEALDKASLREKTRAGVQEVNKILAAGRFDDPETMRKVYGAAAQYGLTREMLKGIEDQFQSAVEFKNRMDLLDRAQQLKLSFADREARLREEERFQEHQQRLALEESRAENERLLAGMKSEGTIAAARIRADANRAVADKQLKMVEARYKATSDPDTKAKMAKFRYHMEILKERSADFESVQDLNEQIDSIYKDVFGSEAGIGEQDEIDKVFEFDPTSRTYK